MPGRPLTQGPGAHLPGGRADMLPAGLGDCPECLLLCGPSPGALVGATRQGPAVAADFLTVAPRPLAAAKFGSAGKSLYTRFVTRKFCRRDFLPCPSNRKRRPPAFASRAFASSG